MSPTSTKDERYSRFVEIAGLEMHYSEWGVDNDEPLLCWHGFSRVGRDYDPIASELADEYRVICPELPGRGLSEWSQEPSMEYTMDAYTEYAVEFLDTLGLDTVRWLGTSMGGNVGIRVGGRELRDRITHLVLNDAGPGDPEGDTDEEGIERIVEYLSNPPAFPTATRLEAYYRDVYEPFSEMTDAEWQRFTLTSARRNDEGQFRPSYDPATVEPYFRDPAVMDQWNDWEDITADIFLLRGEHSDVVSEPEAERMREHPNCRFLKIDGCGHAPSLNVSAQIDPIRSFLAE